MASFTHPEVYPEVKRWLVSLESGTRSSDFASASTSRLALFWLKKFCKFVNMNPSKLIADRIETLESKNEIKKRQHEEWVQQFLIHLEHKDYASNTRLNALGMLRSFYKHNYYDLRKIKSVTPRPVRAKKVPMLKDLKKMCRIADISTRAWICCQVNSGLANIDLINLNLGNLSSEYGTIRRQLKRGIVPIHIEINRKKTGERVDSFFGPNAIDALNDYLGGRTRDLLFGRGMSMRTIQKRVKAIGIRSRVATKNRPTTPYTLRDAFNTLMKQSGMNEAIVERMMGHSIGRVRGAYLVIGEGDLISGLPISELASTYMKHYGAIDVGKISKTWKVTETYMKKGWRIKQAEPSVLREE